MRLFIEGTPEEFSEKHEELVKALSAQLEHVSPDLVEVLEKALPNKEPALKFRAMEQLRKRTSAMYRDTLDAMLKDIAKVLDGESVIKKSGFDWDAPPREPTLKDLQEFQRIRTLMAEQATAGLEKAERDFPDLPRLLAKYPSVSATMSDGTVIKSLEEGIEWGVKQALKKGDKQVRSTPGEGEDSDPDYTEEGEPIFNTEGETPTEEAERVAKEGPEDTDEEEPTEKSGLAEHVNDVHSREGVAYSRIKRILTQKKGYTDSDFEEGGPLYGWSVNELLEIARPKF